MESDSEILLMTQKEREKALVLEKLKEVPIVQVACHKAGVGRSTYYRWRQEDPAFARACEDAQREGIEFINDMSESQVVSLIQDKKLPAIVLWLRHHHPAYSNGSKIITQKPPPEKLTPEQEAIVRKALKLSSLDHESK